MQLVADENEKRQGIVANSGGVPEKNIVDIRLRNPFDTATVSDKVPLTGKVDIYPKEIYYGDAFFVSLSLRNEGNTPIACNFSLLEHDFGWGRGELRLDDKIYYRWLSPDRVSAKLYPGIVGIAKSSLPETTTVLIESKSQKQVLFNMYWLPVLGVKNDRDINDITDAIYSSCFEIPEAGHASVASRSGCSWAKPIAHTGSGIKTDGTSFDFSSTMSIRWLDNTDGIPDHFLNQFTKKYFVEKNKIISNGKIRVKLRSDAVLKLLREWYAELPIGIWESSEIFVRVGAARKTALTIPEANPTNSKTTDQSKEYHEYHRLYESIKTRTPEVDSRIKRTDELAVELLKLPDSELSPNMKEFIQLRKFLVDIRYAENTAKEQQAFDNLVTFVNNSKDKNVWIPLVRDCVFGVVWRDMHGLILFDKEMTYRKLWRYRSQFNKKFP
ncbi:MAG: hypothetical protein LBJ00_01110 [Planctomycetaceae bacterium]|nr:hypothetical protein [Planctomycetaceae bacterium]